MQVVRRIQGGRRGIAACLGGHRVRAVGLAGCLRETLGRERLSAKLKFWVVAYRTWQSGHPCHKHLEALWVLSFPNEHL